MKKFIRILLLSCISLVAIILIGCDSNEIGPLLYKDKKENETISSNIEGTKLNYSIDKVTLTNSYQSIKPHIEILKNGLDTNLFLSLGLMESSGVNIEKIEKSGKNVNIYVRNETKSIKSKLVVPQIILNFKDLTRKNIEDLSFKIINENYQPIKTNLDISEAINKIEAALKISTSTFPEVKIQRKNDKAILDLCFTNTVDLKDKENPIINLNVLIDLSSGEIINSKKSPVSSLIDDGEIIEYLTDRYIVYIKEDVNEDNIEYHLWLYDIKEGKKKILYTSENKISSFKFNHTGDKALIIEAVSESKNSLYILDLKDLELEKLELENGQNPSIAIWKDEDIILVDKKDSKSKIYSYNISRNKSSFISEIDVNIIKIEYSNSKFLYTIKNDDSNEIYITDNFKENLLIDKGIDPSFIDDENITYLKENKDNGKILLWNYNLKEESIKNYTDINIEDFFVWGNNLAIIEKNHIGTNNPLSIYNLTAETIEFETSVKSNKIFLNTQENILYINSYIVVKEEKIPVISYIDLNKLPI